MPVVHPECGNCARPITDGAGFCMTCTKGLAEALSKLPGLVDDLLISLARQDRLGGRGGQRGERESPLPVRLDISDVIWALGNTLTTWARDVAEAAAVEIDTSHLARPVRRHPHDLSRDHRSTSGQGEARCPASDLPCSMCAHCRGIELPRQQRPDEQITVLSAAVAPVIGWRWPSALDSTRFAAEWLAEHMHLLRRHPHALHAHREITRAIELARARVDRRPSLAYHGACAACGEELRAASGAATVTCPGAECGEVYDGPTLREQLLERAADELVTAPELSAALSALSGEAVAVGTIHSWHSRHKLAPHAWLHDAHLVLARPHLQPTEPGSTETPRPERCCRPLYRVGDATKLHRELQRS